MFSYGSAFWMFPICNYRHHCSDNPGIVPCSQRSPGTAELPQWLSLLLYNLDRTLPYPGAPLKCCQGCRVQIKDPPPTPARERQLCQLAQRALVGQKGRTSIMAQGNQIPFLLAYSWPHWELFILFCCLSLYPPAAFRNLAPPVPMKEN